MKQVNYSILVFLEPKYMVFPELHVDIGLVNTALDKFYLFIDTHVELSIDEENVAETEALKLMLPGQKQGKP